MLEPQPSPSSLSQEIFSMVLEQQRMNYNNHAIKAKKLVRDVRLSLLQDDDCAPHQKQCCQKFVFSTGSHDFNSNKDLYNDIFN